MPPRRSPDLKSSGRKKSPSSLKPSLQNVIDRRMARSLASRDWTARIDPRTPTTQIFSEVSEQVALADQLGYCTAWFAEHHFSNYCMCASPLMMVAHCAAST